MTSFYLIDATDGQLRRADLTAIGNANDMLRNIARSEPVVIRDFPARGYTAKISQSQVVIGRKMQSVRRAPQSEKEEIRSARNLSATDSRFSAFTIESSNVRQIITGSNFTAAEAGTATSGIVNS